MRVFDIKALEQGPEKFNKNIADAGRFNDFDGASEICGQGKFKSADGYASMDKFNGVNVADSADKDGAAKFNAAGKICGGAVEFGGTTGLESIAELSDVAEPKGAAEFDSADKFKDGRSAGSDGSSLAYGACRGEDKFKNMDGSSPAHGARDDTAKFNGAGKRGGKNKFNNAGGKSKFNNASGESGAQSARNSAASNSAASVNGAGRAKRKIFGFIKNYEFSKHILLMILIAFAFSVAFRMWWVYWASGFPNYFFWDGELMINTNDGYAFAEGARDRLAGFHQPNDLSYFSASLSILTAFLAKILPFSLESIFVYLSVVCSSLIVVPILLISSEFRCMRAGFIGALVASVANSYYNRTMAGYYDTDMLNIVLDILYVVVSVQLLAKFHDARHVFRLHADF